MGYEGVVPSVRAHVESARHIVVGGVSGTGKSSVARALADRLGWVFLEGDELHPKANVTAMTAGRALTDEDRWPWLDAIARWAADQEAAGRSTVTACSALRRVYRDRLRDGRRTSFVLLTADREVLRERMQRRVHFMPVRLLDSQLATYEPPGPDEDGIEVDATQPLDDTIAQVVAGLGIDDSAPETR